MTPSRVKIVTSDPLHLLDYYDFLNKSLDRGCVNLLLDLILGQLRFTPDFSSPIDMYIFLISSTINMPYRV